MQAGGKWVAKGNARRLLDDHLHDAPDAVYELLEEVAARTEPGLTIVLERDGHYPTIESLLTQLERAREAVACGRARRTLTLREEAAA